MFKKAIGIWCAAIGGMVAGVNIAVMYPNPDYDASWLTVVMAVITMLTGIYLYGSDRGKQA